MRGRAVTMLCDLLALALAAASQEGAPTPSIRTSSLQMPTTTRACVVDPWLLGLPPEHVREFPGRISLGARTDLYCAVYCMYIAMRVLGAEPVPPYRLCKMMNAESGVCSIHDIVNAARALGYTGAAAVRIDADGIDLLPLPAIAYRRASDIRNGHFVALVRREGSLIQMIDYPRYVAWVPIDRLRRFDGLWQGEVVLLQGAALRGITPRRAALLGASLTCAGWSLLLVVALAARCLRRRIAMPRS